MIKLTIGTKSEPEIHFYQKKEIILGSDPVFSDLVICQEHIAASHLKLFEQEGLWILLNISSDSLTFLNGHLFERKLLNNGDVIKIHETLILFEKIEDKQPLEENEHSVDGLPSEAPSKKGISLKDDYLKYLDDENPKPKKNDEKEEAEPSHLLLAWRSILYFIFGLLALAALIGSFAYWNMSDKSENYETKATSGLADIAMAIIEARLQKDIPPHNNWSDMDFLKRHLQSILPATFSYASQIDAQGYFSCCPYTLRIYTSHDLSNFLLIAQPLSTTFYSLMRTPIIVVDSELMELRSLQDIKTLNRLLAHPEPLEGLNRKEITAVVKQGFLIRLGLLAAHSKQPEFSPPKEATEIKKGAENLIYNAPRYYRLGEHLIQKMELLFSSKGNSQEVKELKDKVSLFSSLPHYILYTDQGEKGALLLKKGLSFFVPEHTFSYGYFTADANGRINQPRLLLDETHLEAAISYETPEKSFSSYENVEEQEVEEKRIIDEDHPIYVILKGLLSDRKNQLSKIGEKLQQLIQKEENTPFHDFEQKFKEYSILFLETSQKMDAELKIKIESLFSTYKDISMEDFVSIVHHLNLELITEVPSELSKQTVHSLVEQIENAKNIKQLKEAIDLTDETLNFQSIDDSKDFLSSYHLLRNAILDKISFFLLQDKSKTFTEDEERSIREIFLNERYIHPNEKKYFLKEYDLIKQVTGD